MAESTSGWSLSTAEVEERYVAAVRRADGTPVVPEPLRGYDGLAGAVGHDRRFDVFAYHDDSDAEPQRAVHPDGHHLR